MSGEKRLRVLVRTVDGSIVAVRAIEGTTEDADRLRTVMLLTPEPYGENRVSIWSPRLEEVEPVGADDCPRCGGPLTYANEVDIGVGVMQGGPRGCDRCQWVEPDPLEALGLSPVETEGADVEPLDPPGRATRLCYVTCENCHRRIPVQPGEMRPAKVLGCRYCGQAGKVEIDP